MVTFINKDSTSQNVARSTPAERRLINEQSREHRGSARAASARSRVRQRLRPSEIRLPLPSLPDEETSGGIGELAARVNDRRRCGRELVPALPQTSTLLTATNTTSIHVRVPSGEPRSNPGHPIDPFQTSSIHFNASVIHLLRYYKEVYYDVIWESITTALLGKIDATTIPRCTAERVVIECMENRTRMYCLLADTGCYMKVATTVDVEFTQLQLLQRGTESLREEMALRESNVDTDILIDAMHLYLAALRTNREDATKAHLAGVRAILREMIKRGVPMTAPNLALLALVDVDLSYRCLRRMDVTALPSPTVRIGMSADVASHEKIEALPPDQRP